MEEDDKKQPVVPAEGELQKPEDRTVAPVGAEKEAEELAELLDGLPDEKKAKVMAIVHTERSVFSGPLPHPDLLKDYEEAQPGAANIIINMATKEQDHRHHMEDDMLKQRSRKQNRGQMYGCGLAVFFALVAFAMTLTGHETVAGVVFGTTIIGVLIIYVLGVVPEVMKKRPQADEDSDKSGN